MTTGRYAASDKTILHPRLILMLTGIIPATHELRGWIKGKSWVAGPAWCNYSRALPNQSGVAVSYSDSGACAAASASRANAGRDFVPIFVMMDAR
jgi:hypothetical protein